MKRPSLTSASTNNSSVEYCSDTEPVGAAGQCCLMHGVHHKLMLSSVSLETLNYFSLYLLWCVVTYYDRLPHRYTLLLVNAVWKRSIMLCG